MNRLDPNKEYPQDLEGLRPYVNPNSPQALDDIALAQLRKKSIPTAFGTGNSGRFEAISILSQEYGRGINWDVLEYAPQQEEKKGIPRWAWLLGAVVLVGWYVSRDSKKGIFGVLKGKTFDAGDLS
jgi:hypothetical protein